MGCFSCMSSPSKDARDNGEGKAPRSTKSSVRWRRKTKKAKENESKESNFQKGNMARSFTFKELALATQNFNSANLLGRGGFGSVYKGRLESGLVVAVKLLNFEGDQGNREFIVEVLMLSLLHNPNLVNLYGYCNDGHQRILVYEFMPKGSLDDHLFDVGPGKTPLSWSTRLKIAVGAARGIEYLHCVSNPPVIYRDLKSSNILLDNDFNVKLSDFGLAKLGPVGDNTHVSTRVMGTYGYCAPEYAMSGKLTLKSDIYSLGVVILELITGRRAIDDTKSSKEQNLVVWARPYMKDRTKFIQMADPLLERQFSTRTLNHAIAIAAMCLQEEASFRPAITDIVLALEYLASQAENPRGGGSHSRTSSSSARQQDPEQTL